MSKSNSTRFLEIVLFLIVAALCFGNTAMFLVTRSSNNMYLTENGLLLEAGSKLDLEMKYGFRPMFNIDFEHRFSDVAFGNGFTLFMNVNNMQVYVSGKNKYIESDNAGVFEDMEVFLVDVKSMAAGSNHILFTDRFDNLYAFGRNHRGQIGNGAFSTRTDAVKILSDIVKVYSDGDSSYAIDEQGSLYAWGDNSFGQLGMPDITSINKPKKIMRNVDELWISNSSVYVLTKTGRTYAWGNNVNGQLGFDSGGKSQGKPVRTVDFTDMSTGKGFAVFVSKKGDLYLSGKTMQKYFDKKNEDAVTSPIKILENAKCVTCTSENIFVELVNGEFVVAGKNDIGQTGLGYDDRIAGFKPLEISDYAVDAQQSYGDIENDYYANMEKHFETNEFSSENGDIFAGLMGFAIDGVTDVYLSKVMNDEEIFNVRRFAFPGKLRIHKVKYSMTELEKEKKKIIIKWPMETSSAYFYALTYTIPENSIVVELKTNNAAARQEFRKSVSNFEAIKFVQGHEDHYE